MGFQLISQKELEYDIKYNRPIVIDLRTEEEYKTGHIKTAIHISYDQLDEWIKLDNTILERYFPNQTIILYCHRGNLSLMAARELGQLGYQVKTLSGGMNNYRGVLE